MHGQDGPAMTRRKDRYQPRAVSASQPNIESASDKCGMSKIEQIEL